MHISAFCIYFPNNHLHPSIYLSLVLYNVYTLFRNYSAVSVPAAVSTEQLIQPKQPKQPSQQLQSNTKSNTNNTKQRRAFDPNITWEQLWYAHNGSSDDPWICIHGNVYAMSKSWIEKHHPGGPEMLLLFAGRDATHAFESYHLLPTAQNLLTSCSSSNSNSSMLQLVGRLATHQFPVYGDSDTFNPVNNTTSSEKDSKSKKNGLFYSTLKQRVVDHFRSTQSAGSATGAVVRDKDINFRSVELFTIANTVFILGGMAFSYYMSMYSSLVQNYVLVQFLFAVLSGLFHHLSMVHLWHDLGHASYGRNSNVWSYFGSFGEIMVGHSMEMWKHRHCVGHHIYTNVSGADPDLGIYKASPAKPILPYRAKVQIVPTWFQPYLYFLSVHQMQMDDYFSYWRRSMENIKMHKRSLYDRAVFYGCKAGYLLHRIVLPIALGTRSPLMTFALFLVANGIAGVLFGLFSQTTHVTEEMEWPAAPLITGDWAEMQVLTATDYAHDSTFWTYMSGYLNYQVVHHLLPSVAPHNYPALLPIVKQTCQDFDIKYTILPSFWSALASHLNHLDQFQVYRRRFQEKIRSGEVKVDMTLILSNIRDYLGLRNEG